MPTESRITLAVRAGSYAMLLAMLYAVRIEALAVLSKTWLIMSANV
jgi:hypothetical protein